MLRKAALIGLAGLTLAGCATRTRVLSGLKLERPNQIAMNSPTPDRWVIGDFRNHGGSYSRPVIFLGTPDPTLVLMVSFRRDFSASSTYRTPTSIQCWTAPIIAGQFKRRGSPVFELEAAIIKGEGSGITRTFSGAREWSGTVHTGTADYDFVLNLRAADGSTLTGPIRVKYTTEFDPTFLLSPLAIPLLPFVE